MKKDYVAPFSKAYLNIPHAIITTSTSQQSISGGYSNKNSGPTKAESKLINSIGDSDNDEW